MLILSLDDAVEVCMRLLQQSEEYECMPEFIKCEFEQKCWFQPETDDAAKRLNDLMFDINPAEICAQIESDNLRNWCDRMQVDMYMAMANLPCWAKE